MKKVKIFQIVPNLGTGGGEKIALDIAINLNKDIFDITLLSLFNNKNNIYNKIAEKNNVKVHYFNKRDGIDLKLIYDIMKYFKNEKPDIIHTHLGSGIYTILGSIMTGIKVKAHTVHNEAEKELPKIHKSIMSIAYRYLGYTPIAISDYIRNTILQTYKLRLEDVPCIYNGINMDIFKPNENKTDDRDIIQYINVGRMSEQKNQLLLIDSFNQVQKIKDNISLKIIGDGELRTEIERRIKKYNLQDKIELLGIKENVVDYMNDSDIFVLSSNYEGLPLVLLEAMACKLPIISTKVGGVIDIIENNKNGIIVEQGNVNEMSYAMIEMYEKSKRDVLSKNAYTESKKYDIKNMVKKYEEFYLKGLKNDKNI